eukprot:3771098-Prymnesium_polylepis.3
MSAAAGTGGCAPVRLHDLEHRLPRLDPRPAIRDRRGEAGSGQGIYGGSWGAASCHAFKPCTISAPWRGLELELKRAA